MPRYDDSIIVQRGTSSTGGYGSTELDWSAPTETPLAATVQPLSSLEDVVGQERTITRWRVHTDPADITAQDRIVWDGGTYEVDGDVEVYKRRGVLHHLEFVVERIAGG